MIYESNYLMHYRTKGSKNGVRRYQNEDGSLTAEGREHYGVGDPRKAGGLGLHDKQGNKVSVGSNVKAAYKNSGRVAKAAFKMLFKKKNGKAAPQAAGGLGNQNKKKETDQKVESDKPKTTSRQQKIRKASKIMARTAQVAAAAALVGYGIKNRKKIKEAASLIKDVAGDFGSFTKGSYHDAKAQKYERKGDMNRAEKHRSKRKKTIYGY